MSTTFPWPLMTPTTDVVWDGLKDGELRIMRCRTCSATYWPFTGCRNHDNEPYLRNMEWVAASGLGRVFTFSIHLQTFHPAFPAPYVFAIVELDEGPLIPATLTGFEPAPGGVHVGDRVRAVFERLDDDAALLRFAPAADGVSA